MKKLKAVTLNELLIAIAIIGIMSTVIIVGLNSLLPHWQLSGATKELMASISETQGYSVSQQVIHKINFIPDNRYQIIKEDPGGDQVIKTIDLPSRVTISQLSPNITNNIIKFNFVGAPLDSSDQPLSTAQITLTNGNKTSTIEISPAGNVRSY